MKNKLKKHSKILISIISIFVFALPIVAFAEEENLSWLDKAISGMSNAAGNTTRSIFATIDSGIYKLIEGVFGLFFDVANSNFLVGDIYGAIFKRIFLILGIFMLFKLMFSFLTYIISPDTMSDSKNPGSAGKIIGRVVAVLLFLIVLVPAGESRNSNFSGTSNYDKNVRQQGILFGTLQSVQDAVLEDQILSKIILGTTLGDGKMEDAGKQTALTIFSAFYKIRVESLTENSSSGNLECKDQPGISFSDEEEATNYRSGNWDEIKQYVTTTCNSDDANSYLFEYDLFVSTIVGIVTVVLVFFFTFDAALRSIKLGILRLISPIPAISYISPKSAKDGAFANYTKLLMSTYLDLFLRITIIYVVILLISALTGNNTNLIETQGGGLTQVVIIIALLFFAAQAPKFIMQALGIKSKGTGLGFGAALLGGALAGGLAGAATGGFSGAVKGVFGGAAAGSSNQWAAQNGQRPNMSARQAALNKGAQLGSGDPNAKGMGVGAMIGGGISNALAGTNQRNVDKLKAKFFNEQRDLGDRERIASSLGYGHALTNQDWQFLEGQKYANGNDIVRKNATGGYDFLDSSGAVITGSMDDMASALAFDNSEMKKGLGKKQDELDKAKKQNAQHDPKAARPKFTAFKRYK